MFSGTPSFSPATLMEMGRVAAEEVVVTATIMYPNKQQELVSKLEELADVQVGNDCSNLMSLGQLEIGRCHKPHFDVLMSQKPRKVSISRYFPGLSNYSSMINRATSSLYIQQMFLKRMMSK